MDQVGIDGDIFPSGGKSAAKSVTYSYSTLFAIFLPRFSWMTQRIFQAAFAANVDFGKIFMADLFDETNEFRKKYEYLIIE